MGGGHRPNRRVELCARLLVVGFVILVLRHVFTSDVTWYWKEGAGVGLHHLPYRDFMWEFPPLTVVALTLIPISGGNFIVFLLLFSLAMVATEYASLEVLRRAWPEQARTITAWWTACILPLGAVAYFRLDFISVLPVCVALAAMRSRRRRPAAAIVCGIAAKLWPGMLLVVLVGEKRRRDVIAAAAGTIAMVAAWWAFSPSGFAAFLRFRRGQGVQIESMLGALLHLAGRRATFASGAWVVGGSGWGWVDPLGVLIVGAVAAVAIARTWRRRAGVEPMALMAGLVLLLLLGSRLFSPQYLVWAVPFVALVSASGRQRGATALFVGAIACTLTELLLYRSVVFGSPGAEAVVVVRNALLLAAALGYLRGAFHRRPATGVPVRGQAPHEADASVPALTSALR